MIIFCDTLEKFKEEIEKLKIVIDVEGIAKLSFPYLENSDKYTILSMPSYDVNSPQNILYLSKKIVVVYSKLAFNHYEKKLKSVPKGQYVESTIITFILLKMVLRSYVHKFEDLRTTMNALDLNPILDSIENSGRALRALTDRLEEMVNIMITFKEKELEEFSTELISSDYELFSSETRYLLERSRSHIYRIASLRTKSEILSNRQLNMTMKRLIAITTFLAIVSIVVSVPGTIGAIFGIPALSDAYFTGHTTLLTLVLIASTLLSIVLGYAYWKSLRL
jgi:hypothetical protein